MVHRSCYQGKPNMSQYIRHRENLSSHNLDREYVLNCTTVLGRFVLGADKS
jgi:hypothetical protein